MKSADVQLIIKKYQPRYTRIWRYAVYIVRGFNNDLMFLRDFFDEDCALAFIKKIQEQIAKGDYSCLTQ